MFRRMILKLSLRPIHHDTENLRYAADALRPVAGTLSPATDQGFLEWQYRRAIRRAEAGRVVRPDQRLRLRPNQLNQRHQPVFRAVANRRENKSIEKALAYGLCRSAQVRSRDPGNCASSHGPPAALRRTWKLGRTVAATSDGSPRCWLTVWSKARKAAKAAAEQASTRRRACGAGRGSLAGWILPI